MFRHPIAARIAEAERFSATAHRPEEAVLLERMRRLLGELRENRGERARLIAAIESCQQELSELFVRSGREHLAESLTMVSAPPVDG